MFSIRNMSPNLNLNLNLTEERINHDHERENQNILSELMFEKSLTPSDVGKLNRLVVPKQHAVNYLPLIDRGEGKREVSLVFEDKLGKCWRFRYSFWESSQSYVLTKGWSRFVREKRLDAGDMVLFRRHVTESDRFFICWRRREDMAVAGVAQPAKVGGGGGCGCSGQHEWLHAAGESAKNIVVPAGESKRLRLFGVYLVTCQPHESQSSSTDPLH